LNGDWFPCLDGESCGSSIPFNDDITSSIASLRGDGVRPWTVGEGGTGEGVLANNVNRSFIEGEGEGVARGGRLLTAIRCGGGAGGGGEDPKSFVGLGDGALELARECDPIFHSSVESGYGRLDCFWLFLDAGFEGVAAGGAGDAALIAWNGFLNAVFSCFCGLGFGLVALEMLPPP
jgi:hypothetical protein